MASADVTIKIGAETQQAINSMKSLTKTLVGAGGLLYGLHKIKDIFLDIGEAASRQQAAFNKLYLALQGNIKATKDFTKFADQMQDALNIGNDELMTASANFNRLAGLTERELEKLTPLVIDFAQTFGMDLNAAFLLVGKTLTSSTNALTRYGIQVDMTKDKSGKLADIIDKLGKFSGVASASVETFSGRLTHLKNTVDDTKKVTGEFLNSSQYVAEFMQGLEGFVLFLQESVLPGFGSIVEGVVFVVNSGVAAVSDMLDMVVRGWNKLIRWLVEKVKVATDMMGITPDWLNTLAESTAEVAKNQTIFAKESELAKKTLETIAKDFVTMEKSGNLLLKNADFAAKHLQQAGKYAQEQAKQEEKTTKEKEKQTKEEEKQNEKKEEGNEKEKEKTKEIEKQNNLLTSMGGIFDWINKHVGKINLNMEEVGKAIAFVKQHALDFRNILSSIATGDLLGTIRSGFEAIGGAVGEYLGGPEGQQIGSEMGSMLFDAIQTSFQKAWKEINKWIPFQDSIRGVFNLTKEEFKKRMAGWETIATQKLQNFLDNLPLLMEVWNKAAENLRDFWENNKETLRVEIRSFMVALIPVLVDITRIVAPIVAQIMYVTFEESIHGLLLYYKRSLEDMITDMYTSFFDIGETIADGIKSKAYEIGQEIARVLGKQVESTTDTLETFISELKTELGF